MRTWFNRTFFGWLTVFLAAAAVLSAKEDIAQAASLPDIKLAGELGDLTLWLMSAAGGALGVCFITRDSPFRNKIYAFAGGFITSIGFAPVVTTYIITHHANYGHDEVLMFVSVLLGGLAAPLWSGIYNFLPQVILRWVESKLPLPPASSAKPEQRKK